MNAGREGDGLLSAMHTLYDGDEEKAYALLPADEELTAHEAATFGREKRLRALLDEDPTRAGEFSADGFSPLHGAVFGGHANTVLLLLERAGAAARHGCLCPPHGPRRVAARRGCGPEWPGRGRFHGPGHGGPERGRGPDCLAA